MKITAHTIIIFRINKKPNNSIINIYNRYFERVGLDAICLAPYNEDPRPLLSAMKNLNIPGALTVAFEHDPRLIDQVDEWDESARQTKVTGFITQKDGVIKAYAQGRIGLMNVLQNKVNLDHKKIILFGAGKMARGFLAEIQKRAIPVKEIEIYNRTLEKAQQISSPYSFVTKTGSQDELNKATGDIFINLTEVGSAWKVDKEDYVFTQDFVRRFQFIVDVNFNPLLSPLIKLAQENKIPTSPGYETFAYGTKFCLETILNIKVDINILLEEVKNEFK